MIVQHRQAPSRRAASALPGLLLLVGALGAASPVNASEVYEAGEIAIILNAGHTIDEVNGRWGTTTVDAYPPASLYLVHIDEVEDLEGLSDLIETDPAVEEAEANYIQDTPEGVRQMVVVAVGGDYVDFEDQALTERIGLDEAHTLNRGAGVTVAILDTGVDPTHEVFAGRLAPGGYDFVDDDDEPWEEANAIDDDDDGVVDDGYGHGTMVAGIVALVAPDAQLLPIRVLDDEGRGDAYVITKAIHHAMANGATVINMSFGVPRTISLIGHLTDAVVDQGVVVVAAAGNESAPDPPFYPARRSEVIMVTALDSADVKADFADWHEKVHVSAPGTGVRSAYPGGWALGSGCSFATPFVSGEVALVRSAAPHLDPEMVEQVAGAAVDPIYHHPGNAAYLGELGSGRLFLPAAVSGLVAVVDASSVRGPIRAFPNPTPGHIQFTAPFEFTGSETRQATIHDAAGRLIARVTSAPGADLAWDGRRTDGMSVVPGVYFALISSPGRPAERIRFTVIR